MRVVAGSVRGRRLVAPEGPDTRPTSDRVREATFNALASLGALDGAEVLDLFAGSGALGIEALSRGAASATFVESRPAAREAIGTNLSTLGLDRAARVVADDAWAFLGREATGFDLVLLDPPYAFDRWPELGAAVGHLADPGAVLVAEAGDEVDLGAGWEVLRAKRYGGTVVQLARRSALPGGDTEASYEASTGAKP